MTGLLEVTLKRWHCGARVDVIYQHSHQFVLKTYEEQQQKQQLRTTTKNYQINIDIERAIVTTIDLCLTKKRCTT